jgi:predicted metal-binding membrane protein
MSLLGRRATLTTTVLLLAFAAAAWILASRQTSGMMLADLTAPLFMSMWLTMLVAMMFPTIAPIVLAHRVVVLRRGEGSLLTVVFVAGYIFIWTVVGLIPLAAVLAFQHWGLQWLGSRWLEITAGGALALAGLYQFSPWKSFCLRHCRTPMSFILTHDFGGGPVAAFKAGASHGLYCLGCCWALMAVLVIVGLMNLAWMALIAVVFVTEKNLPYGLAVSRVVGGALVLLGLAVSFVPGLLAWLSGGMPAPAGQM